MAAQAGVNVHINSVRRSRAVQTQLYAAYLRGETKYPVAPPGRSKHEYGLAFDISTNPDVNDQLGAIWNAAGGRWSSSDWVHFEV